MLQSILKEKEKMKINIRLQSFVSVINCQFYVYWVEQKTKSVNEKENRIKDDQ